MERYEGKKVVIIGGTSGIGLATAKMLMDGGARVLVTGRSQAGLDSAQKELGKGALVVSSDARSLTDIDALASRVKAEFDTFDLLFVNAGFSLFAPPACSRGRQPRVRSFADQVPLKLRERSEDVKHRLAARCGCINGFGDALERDPLGLQLGHHLDQVFERQSQPVEPPDRQHIARSESHRAHARNRGVAPRRH